MKTTLSGGFAGEARPSGLDQMTLIERLPLLRPDVQVHYEGSIDKRGGNADWDWWLYQDTHTQEWVICEADGPGCLWNFVVHHAVGHSDPVSEAVDPVTDIPAAKPAVFRIKQVSIK